MAWPPASCIYRTHITPICKIDLECTRIHCPNYGLHAWSDVAIPEPISEAVPEVSRPAPTYVMQPGELPRVAMPDLSNPKVRKRLGLKPMDLDETFKAVGWNGKSYGSRSRG